MPITRSYETILKEIDEKIENLSDEWQRVQSKRRMSKKELFKKTMKSRMDLILKVIQKLQTVSRCIGPSERGLWQQCGETEGKGRDGGSTH